MAVSWRSLSRSWNDTLAGAGVVTLFSNAAAVSGAGRSVGAQSVSFSGMAGSDFGAAGVSGWGLPLPDGAAERGVVGAALAGRWSLRARTFSESASTPLGVSPRDDAPSRVSKMRVWIFFHGNITTRSGAMTALARKRCGIRRAISVTGMLGSPRPMRSLRLARSKGRGVDRSGASAASRSVGRRSQKSPSVKVSISAGSERSACRASRLPGAGPVLACHAGRTVRGATEIVAMGRTSLVGVAEDGAAGEAGWDSGGVETSGRFRQK